MSSARSPGLGTRRRLDKAASGLQPAPAAFADHSHEIDLLLTDIVMPQMDGASLYRELCKTNPGLKVLFMSGYSEKAFPKDKPFEPGLPFLSKPFSGEQLTEKVQEALQRTS